MSRIPQPANYGYGHDRPWKPVVNPSDYSDEVTEEDIVALKKLVQDEWCEEDALLVDGPAW